MTSIIYIIISVSQTPVFLSLQLRHNPCIKITCQDLPSLHAACGEDIHIHWQQQAAGSHLYCLAEAVRCIQQLQPARQAAPVAAQSNHICAQVRWAASCPPGELLYCSLSSAHVLLKGKERSKPLGVIMGASVPRSSQRLLL